MSEQTRPQRQQAKVRAPWMVPMVAALVTWLLWRFGAEAFLFAPDITTTLLGFSLAANIGLLTYMTMTRR